MNRRRPQRRKIGDPAIGRHYETHAFGVRPRFLQREVREGLQESTSDPQTHHVARDRTTLRQPAVSTKPRATSHRLLLPRAAISATSAAKRKIFDLAIGPTLHPFWLGSIPINVRPLPRRDGSMRRIRISTTSGTKARRYHDLRVSALATGWLFHMPQASKDGDDLPDSALAC